MMPRGCILLLSVLCGACVFGMTAERFAPASTPAGIRTEVRTAAGVFEGELVEVRDTALIVLSNESGEQPAAGIAPKQLLRLIPFGSIVRAQFHQLGPGADIRNGRPPSARAKERLRLLSRYPYGMTPDVEVQLLKEHGQTALAGAER